MESRSIRSQSRPSSSLRENSARIWRSTDADVFRRSSHDEDDEEALKWAALEKLPTVDRLRKGILVGSKGPEEVDVQDLGYEDKRKLVEKLVKNVDEDNEKFLLFYCIFFDLIRSRLPYQTLLNFLRILPSRKKPFTILRDVSGIIKPCRLTLLLGPPSSGKTTLLLALAGRLDPDQVTGSVTYNGHGMDEFIPQKTAAYISQHDRFITSNEFAEAFQSSDIGRRIGEELAVPFDKSKNHPAALTTKKYGLGKIELLKACAEREFLLMKRNSFVVIFKLFQLTFMAFICMAMYFRSRLHKDNLSDGGIYTGALFFAVTMLMFNGLSEISMTIRRLPVFYKQRQMYFFPPWAYALPTWILNIPVSLLEVTIWTCLTYYVIGLDPLTRICKPNVIVIIQGHRISRQKHDRSKHIWLVHTCHAICIGRICPEEDEDVVPPPAQVVSTQRSTSSTEIEAVEGNENQQRGMILPFEPHSLTFDNVTYSVDMPAEMKDLGATEDRLVLLREVSGAFRPGVLTALMGVSGAGKTTLMDVLAGRKTGGYIDGDIKISGYLKKQETFARISGYCEQSDIHSPCVTVHESLTFSAWLRLPL